ncbi:MAG: putative chaperone protein, partial [Flavobacteriales bacterium]
MIGIDFGTTNSAVARLTSAGPQLAEFSLLGEPTHSFRSVLYFSIEERVSTREPGVFSGPKAIEQYLEEDAGGRYVQSLKSLLPSRTFESTQVLGTVYTLEDMIAEILRGLRTASRSSLGELGGKAVVGRPVHFVGAKEPSDEDHALARLREAFSRSGFDDITFAFEPVAAAAGYAATLTRDETLLVADFGGGTSDFCILQVGPQSAKMPQSERVLATDGVGLAGERFDARIVRERVAPRLGRGTQYKAMGGTLFDIPDWLYVKLSDWHELSFLRAERPLKVLRDVA